MNLIQDVHDNNNISEAVTDEVNFNSTEEDAATGLSYAKLLLTPLILLIALGNIMVIALVGLDRSLRSSTNCFLSSLAVADMLVALIVMPLSLSMIVNNYIWPFSDEICGLWVMLDVFFSTCSILHLCMISFDRYMALAQPFSSRHTKTTTYGNSRLSVSSAIGSSNSKTLSRAAKRILFVWGVALGIALPIPIFGRIDRNNLFVGDMCAINMPAFQIFGSMVAFFLPLVIMFIMYTLTIRTLKRQAQLVSNIMVHNSPPYSVPRTHNRCHSSILQIGSAPKRTDSQKSVYKSRQLEQLGENGEAIFSSDIQINESDPLRQRCNACKSRSKAEEALAQESFWRKAVRMFTNLFRRIKGKTTYSSSSTNNLNNNGRCTCRDNRDDNEKNENLRESVFLRQHYQRCRSSHGRVSSSFKNRAMASINNEQRASKVLGLIFLLFCVFWCPFFITNVTSCLCTTCDQELLGNLMNWFVWVGYVSSGVNPCVYTMFSRRFRRTFFLVMKGRISDVNKNPHRTPSFTRGMSRISNQNRASFGSLRTSTFSVNQNTKSFSSLTTDYKGYLNTRKSTGQLEFHEKDAQNKSEVQSIDKKTSKLWRWSLNAEQS